MGDWQRAHRRPVEQKETNLEKTKDKKVSDLQNFCTQTIKAERNWVCTSNRKIQGSHTFQNKLKCYLLRDIWKDNAKRGKKRKHSILFVKFLTLASRCREYLGSAENLVNFSLSSHFPIPSFQKQCGGGGKAEFKGKNSLKFDSHACDLLNGYGWAYYLPSIKPPCFHCKMKTVSLILHDCNQE